MGTQRRVLYSTSDGVVVLTESEGWVVTEAAGRKGYGVHSSRIALSDLAADIGVFITSLEADGASKPVEVFLGYSPEGDHLYAALSDQGLTIVEAASDGVARWTLAGPYPTEEARRLAEAVLEARKR